MLISEIGEFGLIKRIRKSIKLDSSVIKGSGDDCAVLKFNRDKYLLATCDMLVEGVDFTRKDSPYLVGRKALGVSISDIAACGGIPRYALVSLGLPKNSSLQLADKICRGILDLAKNYRINLIGGDLSRSQKVILDVSLFGFVEKRYLALRSNAKVGDIIFTTGRLGGALSGKHLRFTPPLKQSRYLVENFRINAMIDISDGLLQDLSHILEESRVGAVIYEELIPLSKEARSLEDALYSGEDFELLFSLSRPEAKKLCAKKRADFKIIGEIAPRRYGLKLIDKKGREKIVRAKGFRHF